jgi:predicted acetyltransferase
MIKQIVNAQIQPYEAEMKRAMLTLAGVDFLYGKFVNNSLIGWAGVKATKGKYIYKTAYVLEPFRRQGHYTELLRHLLQHHSDKLIEAVCTPMSYNLYKREGFTTLKVYKNKCKKVIK